MTANQLKCLSKQHVGGGIIFNKIWGSGQVPLMLDMLTTSVQASFGIGFCPKIRTQKPHMGATEMYGGKVDKFDHSGRAS